MERKNCNNIILGLLTLLIFFMGGQGVAFEQQKPIIGILLNEGDEGGYSIYPWYAIRKNYGEVIAKSGGIPIYIGHDSEDLDELMDVLDGIVLTGGDFPTPEEVFTTGLKGPVCPKKYPRSHIEYAIVKEAFARDLPVLGICAGLQDMNAALGGILYQDVVSATGSTIQHRNEQRHKIQHQVKIEPTSKLFQIVQKPTFGVNSNHRAGIKQVAPSLCVVARAPDGVIEAVEAPNRRFFIGVMWHPEFLLSKEEKKLWDAFIDASREYRMNYMD